MITKDGIDARYYQGGKKT